jgi:uncharacterized protein Yka (UPF0111/DUF47 family)
MNLLPRDDTFFHFFAQHLALICDASELLVTGLESGYGGVCRVSGEMKTLEHKGDSIVRQTAQRLQKTILTPFEPEDVQALSTALDNVLDFMQNATFRIVAYRLDPIPSELVDLGRIVNISCNCLRTAWENLVRRRSVIGDCIAVDRLEKRPIFSKGGF